MYVKEAQWYKKQQRQRVRLGWLCKIGTTFALLLLVPLCFYVKQVLAQDLQKETIGVEEMSVLSGAMQEAPLYSGVVAVEAEDMAEKAEALEMEADKMDATESEAKKLQEVQGEATELAVEEDDRYLIVIDVGHGGEDEGCSFEGVEEKRINLYLAKCLQTKLEEMDFEVFLTRTEDEQLELEDRVKIANDINADAFISIHQNSCEDNCALGIETYYCLEGEGNERLAKLVQQYVVLYTKARDRGIREENNLYVIRECNMPSCLVETGFLSNEEERELLQDEVYCEKIVQGLADAIQLYFYPKVMYLTFDDGPSAENTEAVLDILQKKGIKATFFVVGENVERYPEVARRIVEEGHSIGIHCYNHSYDKLYASVESYLEDFEKAKEIVYETTGVETKLFRFPGGSVNSYNKKVSDEIIVEMTARGYIYFDWNASFEDAVKKATPEKIMQNAKESTLGRKKIVMLAHDIVDETVACLEDIIDGFPEYEMRALDEKVEAIQF